MSYSNLGLAYAFARRITHREPDRGAVYIFKTRIGWHVTRSRPIRGRNSQQHYYMAVEPHGLRRWYEITATGEARLLPTDRGPRS